MKRYITILCIKKLKFDEEMGNEQLTIYVDNRHNKWCTVKKGSDADFQIFDFADILAVNLINEQALILSDVINNKI